MRYSPALIARARQLRKQGKTYSEITRALKINPPKSTISHWCSDVKLPTWYVHKIKELNKESFTKAQRMAWASNKIKRERFLKALVSDREALLSRVRDKKVLKMLLAMLHLGEGAKWQSHQGLMLGSSDPIIVNLYIRLLYLCYGIPTKEMKCRVCYRADQNIRALEKYWSQTTSIPLENFYKTKLDSRTIGRPTRKLDYKGVCVVSHGGTHIQLELEEIPRIVLKGL